MKIAYISEYSISQPFIGGGTVSRFFDFAKKLSKKNRIIWIATANNFSTNVRVKISSNFLEFIIPALHGKNILIRLLGAIFTFFGLLRIYTREKIDILICHHATLVEGLASVFSSKICSFPLLMDYVDRFDLGPIAQSVQNFILTHSDGVMTITKPLAFIVRQSGIERVFHISHTVVPSILNVKVSKQEKKEILSKYGLSRCFLVGYLGSLLENQGIHDLIIAFKKANLENAKLMIVGGASWEFKTYEKELHRLVKQQAMQDKIIFTGYVYPKMVPKFLSVFNLGVIPKVRSLYNQMCFPTKATEYISMSVPTLGTQIGIIPELLQNGEGGYLCEPSNPDDLAEALQRAYDDRENAGIKAKKALNHLISKYNFSLVYLKLKKAIVYTYLAKRRKLGSSKD